MLVLFVSLGEGKEDGMGFAQSAFSSFGSVLFLQEATLIGSSEKNSWRCQEHPHSSTRPYSCDHQSEQYLTKLH
jgi:hypothetical protein